MKLKILEQHLREKHFLVSEFEFYKFALLPSGNPTTAYFLGSLTTVYKKGKKAGNKKFTNVGKREFYLSFDECDRIEKEWGTKTGNCISCMGDKQTIASSHVDGTTIYRKCNKCKGTGKYGDSE